MNLFNRLLLTILLVLLAALGISVIALAWVMPDDSITWLRDAVQWMDENDSDTNKVILSIAAGAIALVLLSLAVVEMIPSSPDVVKVSDLQVGDAVLSTAAVGQRIEEAINQVREVAETRANVKAKKRGVTVALDLHVEPRANLAEITDEACEVTTDVLTNRVHVALAEPIKVRLHYRELRLNRNSPDRRDIRPAPAPVPAQVVPPPATESVTASEPESAPKAKTTEKKSAATTAEAAKMQDPKLEEPESTESKPDAGQVETKAST